MADFAGVDFLRLDDLLSDEEKLARDTVRGIVNAEFLPRIQEHVRRDGSYRVICVVDWRPNYDRQHHAASCSSVGTWIAAWAHCW